MSATSRCTSGSSPPTFIKRPRLADRSHENTQHGHLPQPATAASSCFQPTPQNVLEQGLHPAQYMQPLIPGMAPCSHTPMGCQPSNAIPPRHAGCGQVDIHRNQNIVQGNQTNFEGGQTNIGTMHINNPTYNMGQQMQNTGPTLDLNRCRKRLKAIYKAKRKNIGFLPGMPKEFNIEDFFVELTLLREERNPADVRHKRLVKYTDLLSITDRRGRKEHHVLIRGLAGTGKTTLISRLAYQWATQELEDANQNTTSSGYSNRLGEFKLLFVLDVRKIKTGMDLADTIKDQLLQNIPKQSLDDWLADNSDACLFLCDGYDELSSNTDIFDDPCMLDAHVIVTTRPRKVQEFIDKYGGYVHVCLEGFSQKSAHQFVLQFFRSESFKDEFIAVEKYNSMASRLNSSPVLMSLIHYPLLLAMMCLLWGQNKDLPETVTSLYEKAIEYIARHWMEKLKREQSNQQPSAKQYAHFKESIGMDKLLVQIGETALSGLMRNNLIFDESEFESINLVNQACSLGVIFKESTVCGFDSVIQVSFIHFTFQEFCAAKYLANIAETDLDRFLKFLDDSIDKSNTRAWEILLKFCCGMSSKTAEAILPHVVRMAPTRIEMNDQSWRGSGFYIDLNSRLYLPFKLVFEADSDCDTVNATVHNCLQPLIAQLDITHLLSPYFPEKEFCTIVESYGAKSRDDSSFQNQIWPAKVEEAIHVFTSNDLLNLHQHAYFVEVSQHLIKLMPNLKTLSLSGDDQCKYKDTSIEKPSKSLCYEYLRNVHNKIEKLSIKRLMFDMNSLLAFLNRQKQLKSLRLKDNSISEEDMTKLLSVLRSTPMLSLDLCHNPLGNDSTFCQAVLQHLQDLSLSHARMDTINCTQLFELFIALGKQFHLQNPSTKLALKKLDMSWNKIGHAARKLAEAFQYMGDLNYLDLSVTNLVETDMKAIASSLHFVYNLEHVAFVGCKIGNAMNELVQGLRQLKKLKVMTICGVVLNTILFDLMGYFLSVNLFCSTDSNGIVSLSHKEFDAGDRVVVPTNIGLHGTIALCNLFQHVSCLTHIDLKNNAMGSEGTLALCNILHHVPLLQVLNLQTNYIGEDGMMALIESFHLIPKLQELRIGIGNDRIQAQCADLFFRNLVYLQELKTLNMPGVDEVTQEEYEKMLPLRVGLHLRYMSEIDHTIAMSMSRSAENLSRHTVLKSNVIQDIISKVLYILMYGVRGLSLEMLDKERQYFRERQQSPNGLHVRHVRWEWTSKD